MICEEYKFVHIHIKKCGGRSLTQLFPDTIDLHENFIDYYKMLRNEIANYFIWTIVRNPWDRMVSLWTYHRDETGFVTDTFDNFIQEIYYKTFLRYYGPQDHYPHSSLPQIDYLTDADGNLAVDYVAFLPNIAQDFEKIKAFCGMPEHIVYPHLFKNNRTHYFDYYSNLTSEMVARLYEKEIELFEFKYDDPLFFKYPYNLETEKKQQGWRDRIDCNMKLI